MLKGKWGVRALVAAMGCVSFVADVSCGSPPIADAGAPEDAVEGGDATAEPASDAVGPIDHELDATVGDVADVTSSRVDGAGVVVLSDGAQTSDGAAVDATMDAACMPAAGCPSSAACGRYVDPCSGKVFACGAACTGANVCSTNPSDPTTQTCQPKQCAGRCGVVGIDGCGVAIGCGGCSAGMACANNECVPAGPRDAGQCAPLTCAPSGQNRLCGTVTDGCGNTLACSCATGQSCSGGVCSAPPPECTSKDAGAFCGSVANACGSGSIACGGCAAGTHCTGGVCSSCAPLSCGAAQCGQVTNACGQSETCGGTCQNSEICNNGVCCAGNACAAAEDAGTVTGCNPIDLGCGVKKSCAPCATGEVCTNNQCVTCVPKTCSDFANTGCGHSDGCGKTLNCCAAETTCQSSVCCPEGQVNYNGSCCQPACDPTQPSGAQTSCGQVIVCSG